MSHRLLVLLAALLLAGTNAVPARAVDAPASDAAAELLALAENGFSHALLGYSHGGSNFHSVADWSDRVLATCRDPDLPKEKRIAAMKAHVERIRKLEAITAERFKAGTAAEIDAIGGKFLRLQVERALAQLEAAK